jgi:hypothetical protein
LEKKKLYSLSALAGGLTWEIYFVDLHNLFFLFNFDEFNLMLCLVFLPNIVILDSAL